MRLAHSTFLAGTESESLVWSVVAAQLARERARRADAVAAVEQKLAEVRAKIETHRELSTALAYEDGSS